MKLLALHGTITKMDIKSFEKEKVKLLKDHDILEAYLDYCSQFADIRLSIVQLWTCYRK